MKKYLYLAYDSFCICVTLVAALYLRHGIPLIQEGKPADLYLLLVVTWLTTLCILPLMRTHTSMWRFTSGSDLGGIMIAMALVVLVYNTGLFLISRLEMMPRSVPPMHWALAVVAMGGSRLLARQFFGPSRFHAKHHVAVKQHVIIIGAGHAAELYLQFIKRIVQHPVVVEGLLDSDKNLTHRIFQKHKILGTPEQIPQILEEFRVHGIHIKQVVLAQVLYDLSQPERDMLLQMQRDNVIELVHFGQHMGPQFQPRTKNADTDFYQYATATAHEYIVRKGLYPYIKRAFDITAGLALLVVFLPFLLLTALVVALDVGFPVIFWQQRPGLRGKPFRLYKFRTMRQAGRRHDEDRLSHKSSDLMRTSLVGKWLRRLRLDELPQLFHIIAGTMSFVGPRPLLPDDQPAGGHVRLSVRPGVTGWAQIHGGDTLTPEEKLVLDRWYLRHMSLRLDIAILLRTLLVVLKPDMRRTAVIEQTRASNTEGSANA